MSGRRREALPAVREGSGYSTEGPQKVRRHMCRFGMAWDILPDVQVGS